MKQNGYVLDPDNPSELTRLFHLDRAITACMGGPLAGDMSELHPLKNMLYLACGPGGWVLDAAFALRGQEVKVVGVDISAPMIEYANALARTQQRTNASFEVMDITRPLAFADGVFDLVNARFLVGVLGGRSQWEVLLAECVRLLRRGGMIRLTETDGLVISTCHSLARLQQCFNRKMHERGYGFSSDGGQTLGITPLLPHLLRDAGFQQIRLTPFVFDGSQPDGAWMACLRLCEFTYYLAYGQGLLDDMTLAPGETVPQVIERMLADINASAFGCLTYGLMVSAQLPTEGTASFPGIASLQMGGSATSGEKEMIAEDGTKG
jgi:SAM-dependent methyltransferase